MPSQEIDVNLEPNKTKILLKNKMYLINCIDDILSNYYNNGNFHCSALIEDLVNESFTVNNTNEISQTHNDDDDDDDEISKERQNKKLKLDVDEITEPVVKKINNDNNANCTESVNKWAVEIINEDIDLQSSEVRDKEDNNDHHVSLCSQINKENCILTTDDEVSKLNTVLNEKNYRMITSANSKNCMTRLIERNDLQSQISECKILPEWPKRENLNLTSNDMDLFSNEDGGNVIEEERNGNEEKEKTKTVEEIVREIEMDAEKWSRNVMEGGENKKDEEEEDIKTDREDDVDKNILDFNTTIQNISNRMSKKEMKAFTKFARIMRPKSKSPRNR